MHSNIKSDARYHGKRTRISVLFLTLYVYGMKTYTDEIVKRLMEKEIDVKVEVCNTRFSFLGQFLFHLRNIFRHYRHFDIIISNNFTAPFLFSQRKIEIFHHSYYEIMKRTRFSFRFFVASLLQLLSTLGAKKIIVPSFTTKKTIPGIVNHKRIHVIPNGIRFHKAKRLSHEELAAFLGLKTINGNVILTVGRYDRHKGHERTLKAFMQSSVDGTLIYAGFDNREFIDPFITRYPHYKDRIIMLGEVSEKVLDTLYASADIYMALPYIEGFGFTFLEAMVQGIPVIAPKIQPIIENVGDAGILVSGIVDASKALRKLDSDENYRNEIGKSGEKRVKIFNWDNSIRKFLVIIKSLFRS